MENENREWKEVRLGDVCDLITGFAFKSEEYSTDKGELRVVRGDNVTEGYIRWEEKTRYWNNSIIGLEKYLLKENDILIGMDGSKVGKNRALVRKKQLPLILAQRVACIRAKEEVDQKFVAYNVICDRFLKYVDWIGYNK